MGAVLKSLAWPGVGTGDEPEKEEKKEQGKEEGKEELGGTAAVSVGIVGGGGSVSKGKRKRRRRKRSCGSEGVLVLEESPRPKKKRRPKDHEPFVRNNRLYDCLLGETCHWCRQKTVDKHVRCSRPSCTVKYCPRCLINRHGEEVDAEMDPQVLWVCPKCPGGCGPGCNNCCNCGPCRKAQGLEPTGHLKDVAKKHGFTNAHDYLVHKVTGEGQDALAARKRGRCWTSDGGARSLGQEENVGSVEEGESGLALSRVEEDEGAGCGDFGTCEEARGGFGFEAFPWEGGGMASVSPPDLLGHSGFEAVLERWSLGAHLPPGEDPGPGRAASCGFENVKVEMEVAGTADNVRVEVAEDVPVAAGTAGWSFQTVKVEIAEDVSVAADWSFQTVKVEIAEDVSVAADWSSQTVKVEIAEDVSVAADWSFGSEELAGAGDVFTVGGAGRALGELGSDVHVGAHCSAAGVPPGCQILKSVKSEFVDDVLDGAGAYRACGDPTPSVSAVEDSGATGGTAPAWSWSYEDVKVEVEEDLLDVLAGTQQVCVDPRPNCEPLAHELEVVKLELGLGEDVPAPVTGPVADCLSSKNARSEIVVTVQDAFVPKTSSSNGKAMHADIAFGFGFEPVRVEEDAAVEGMASLYVAKADVVEDASQISGLCTEETEADNIASVDIEDTGDYCHCGYFDPPSTEGTVICLSDSESEKDAGKKDGNKIGSLSSQAVQRELRRITRSKGSWKPTPSKKRVREGLAKLSVAEPCEENRWPFGEKGNGFQEKLDAFLNEPFSEQELLDKMDLAKRRKPKEKVRQMRQRVVVCRTTEKGLSYLDHYPGFAEKLSSARDKAEKLALLRGFFFWLQYPMLPGAFQPWNKGQDKVGETDDCVEVDPDCELVAVCVPVDSKPAGAKKRASSLPKADGSRGPASGKVGTASLVRKSLNFPSKKGTSSSKRGQ